MSREAPYSHADGSNCWTKGCSRGGTLTDPKNAACSPIVDPQQLSRTMSFALRHRPERLGITLDKQGFATLQQLANQLTEHFGIQITPKHLVEIAVADSKGRYVVEGDKIRAAQGHSVQVDLGLKPITPPNNLYHGTSDRFLASILASGLKKGTRQYVHLSEDLITAGEVGTRHKGKLVILLIDTVAARTAGIKFYRAANGVWLSGEIPSKYFKKI